MHSSRRALLRASLLGGLLLAAAPSADAQVAKLYPVDEAARDPSFFAFRARLLQALQERDTAFVYAMLHPRIRNSFGGNGGIAEFREKWKPGAPDSELWGVLTTVLALGGTMDEDGRFTAPYVFSRFPDELDTFESAAVVGEGVRVRARPDTRSEVLATLSFDVVALGHECGASAGSDRRGGWTGVRLADGACGFIAERYVRSPIDYRAIFQKVDGRWRMMLLIAGD